MSNLQEKEGIELGLINLIMKMIIEIVEFIDKIGGIPVLYAMLACIIFLIFAYKMVFDLNPNVLTDEDIIRMGKNSKKSWSKVKKLEQSNYNKM